MSGKTRERRMQVSGLRKSGDLVLMMGSHTYWCNPHKQEIPCNRIGQHVRWHHVTGAKPQ